MHSSLIRCEVARNLLAKAGESKAVAQEPSVETPESVVHAAPPPVATAPKKVVKSETVVCPVCEARKKKDRERVRKWRAKK